MAHLDSRRSDLQSARLKPDRRTVAGSSVAGPFPDGVTIARDHVADARSPARQVRPLIEMPFASQRAGWAIRALEIPFALAALLLSLPIMLVLAFLIWRDSPGPVLFFQTRVGLGTKPFRFVKFRTMQADARTRFPELYAYRYSPEVIETVRFKVDPDPRLTRVGRWLRRTSFDELPNFWNVLTGDMALVGPRPEIPEMLPYYEGEMLRKFTVRPGVTGLAQISGRGRLRFLETVDFDVAYVKNRSLAMDIRLMLKTVRMVILRDGAF